LKRIAFIVLNIYLLNFSNVFSQDLKLQIKVEDTLNLKHLDNSLALKRFKNFSSLSSSFDSIFNNLQNKGFINLKATPIQKVNDSIFESTLNLGKQVDSIFIDIPQSTFTLKQLKSVDPNANESRIKIPISKTQSILNYLNNLQANSESPFSSLSLKNIKINKTSLHADLSLESTKQRTIDKIIINGYEKFPNSFIRYGARLKIKQPFNRETLKRKSKQLDNLSFATTKKDPEILFTKDSTSVYLYIEKKKSNSFDGFLGFSNNAETGNLEFNGYLDLNLTNNLDFGESLNLTYKSDGREQVQFKSGINLPYLFKTPVGLLLDLEIFKRDSTFVTVDQNARLNYQITNNSNIYLGYKGTTSSNLEEEPIAGTIIVDYTSNYVDFGGKTEQLSSNKLFPTTFHVSLNSLVGKRTTELLEDTQIRGSINSQYNYQLSDRSYLFAKNYASILLTENYITNELFRFGGIKSIRGFEENSIDASLLNSFQSEFRYILSPNLYTHSVLDYAYYENDVLGIKQQLVSIGFGLGLYTNSGLLKVVFANGKTSDQSFKFDNTKVHLSFFTKF
jgi:hypothetical protein